MLNPPSRPPPGLVTFFALRPRAFHFGFYLPKAISVLIPFSPDGLHIIVISVIVVIIIIVINPSLAWS